MGAPLKEQAIDLKTGFFTPVWQRWFIRTLEPALNIATSGIFEQKSVTISGGEITVTDAAISIRAYTVDTEGLAATDDLDTINGGHEGELLILDASVSARTVVVKDGANLDLQANFSLNHISDKIFLYCKEPGIWHELTRASNGN